MPRQLRPLWATVAASVLLVVGVNLVTGTPDVVAVLLLAIALQRAAHAWWVAAPTWSAKERTKRRRRLAKHLLTGGSVAFMIAIAAINARALRSFPTLVLGLLGGGLLSFGAGAAIQIADQKPRRR